MIITRIAKQFIISLVFLAIFFSIGWLIYSKMKTQPTCFDGIQNQNEQKTDCGGVCQKQCEKVFKAEDLNIVEKYFVVGNQGKYDVMMRVTNPNNQLGGSEFSYDFKLKDANGSVLAEKSGKSYILPLETKYIIETNLETSEAPASLESSATDTKWVEFFGYERPELNIYSKEYNLISSGVGFSEAKGLLRNESSFDFSSIRINVVLRDVNKKPVAYNKNEMNTVNSGEERDFRLLWPVNFPGSVQGVEMEADADVFDSQNFIKKYTNGEMEQFQRK